MHEIIELVEISRYVGQRFDLVQAGGGNSSVKINGDLLVKASGFLLSDMKIDSGYSIVDNKSIIKILEDQSLLGVDKNIREKLITERVNKATKSDSKASIEVFMHALFYKYTMHTHPLAVNAVLCSNNADNIVNDLFPNTLLIDYDTPGFSLAINLKRGYDKFLETSNTPPNVVFLKNHGLIVSADNTNDLLEIQEDIVNKLEGYLKIKLDKYKKTNKVSTIVNTVFDTQLVSYVSDDKILIDQIVNITGKPFFPDQLVYGGFQAVELKDENDIGSVHRYKDQFFEYPKIIIFDGNIFFVAESLRKARDIEDVLRAHIIIQSNAGDLHLLDNSELTFLADWDAEKYRRTL
jgi:ribulose-5-phosphate 4-epimerase/fuculose-1-phosphate aldolase